MRIIKIFFALLFLLAVVLADVYVYQRNRPCVQPIAYRIGTVDPRFHVSTQKVTTLAMKAGKLWNSALGKELFMESVAGSLPISLVYDDRQASADKHKVLETQINQQKNSLASTNASYSSLLQEFQAFKASYEKDIAYWNARGGAPADEYAQLEKRRQLLNSYVERLNALSKQGQVQVAQVNGQISRYNTAGGKKFEGGVFESDAQGNKTITIYEFENDLDLEYVIAHEMGHALGLDHVADPKALMSPEHIGQTLTGVSLKPDDLTELKKVCGGQHEILPDIFRRFGFNTF